MQKIKLFKPSVGINEIESIKKTFKSSLKVWKEKVSLLFFPDLDDKEINYIIKCLKLFDKKNSNG